MNLKFWQRRSGKPKESASLRLEGFSPVYVVSDKKAKVLLGSWLVGQFWRPKESKPWRVCLGLETDQFRQGELIAKGHEAISGQKNRQVELQPGDRLVFAPIRDGKAPPPQTELVVPKY